MSDAIRVLLLGDICLAGDCATSLEARPSGHLLQNVKPLLQSCDLVLGNFECVFSGAGKPNTTKISLFANSNLVEQLHGISGLCLSNNHIGDLGVEGVKLTQQILREKGILNWGVGDTMGEARQPVITTVRGVRVGLLAYTCLTTNAAAYATADYPGVAPLAGQYCKQDISALREQCDYIIVSVHWGVEGAHYPTLDQISLAHSMIDAGADVVWGHHPHVIQPVEFYRGGVIAYSMGNFVFSNFDYQVAEDMRQNNNVTTHHFVQQPKNLESIGVKIVFSKTTHSVQMDNIHAFRSASDWHPFEIEQTGLVVPFQQIYRHLDRMIKKFNHRINAIQEPLISVLFNGRMQCFVYMLPPIDQWVIKRRLLYRGYLAIRSFSGKCYRMLLYRLCKCVRMCLSAAKWDVL